MFVKYSFLCLTLQPIFEATFRLELGGTIVHRFVGFANIARRVEKAARLAENLHVLMSIFLGCLKMEYDMTSHTSLHLPVYGV